MSYTPTTWTTGDTITASAMNKIEQGIANGGGGFVVNVTSENGTLTMDKTFAEIYEAMDSGIPCFMKYFDELGSGETLDTAYRYSALLSPIVTLYKYDDAYRVLVSSSCPLYVSNTTGVGVPQIHTFQASISTDYPTFLRRAYVSSNNVSSAIDFI
jgi:hypothetical protein